jgi:hypothetical protein
MRIRACLLMLLFVDVKMLKMKLNFRIEEKEERIMSQKTGTLTLILSIIAAVLACVAIVMVCSSGKSEAPAAASDPSARDIQYVMYLGTNDKDTNQPVFSPEEAKAQAEDILISHLGGYTIQEANGGWIDDGTVYQEYTLVIYLSDTSPEEIHAAADELIKVFNQSSVLIQANETSTEFYSGE